MSPRVYPALEGILMLVVYDGVQYGAGHDQPHIESLFVVFRRDFAASVERFVAMCSCLLKSEKQLDISTVLFLHRLVRSFPR